MAAKFPSIKPSSREYTMGDVPSVKYTSLSGVVYRRAYGNKQTGHTLKMVFKNIGDVDEIKPNAGTTALIVDHYNAYSGTFESFTLSNRLFAGMEENLERLLQKPANIQWRYAGPPKIVSVTTGVSTVTVTLIGEVEP